MGKRFETRPVDLSDLPTPEECEAAVAAMAERFAKPRKPPPELGPDPPDPGDPRQMALDAVLNISRAAQILAFRVRRKLEIEPDALTLPQDAAKDLRALQQAQQGFAEAVGVIDDLARSNGQRDVSAEDLETARAVVARSKQRLDAIAAAEVASKTPQ